MIEELIKEVKNQQSEINTLKKELLKKSQDVFDKGILEIMNSCEDLKTISWTQYTPYFNDGDTCEFSVQMDYLEVNGEESSGYDPSSELTPYIVEHQGTWNNKARMYEGRIEVPNPKFNKGLADAVDSISKFLGIFDDDFYKYQFGDHQKITVTKTKVTQEEYDHE